MELFVTFFYPLHPDISTYFQFIRSLVEEFLIFNNFGRIRITIIMFETYIHIHI